MHSCLITPSNIPGYLKKMSQFGIMPIEATSGKLLKYALIVQVVLITSCSIMAGLCKFKTRFASLLIQIQNIYQFGIMPLDATSGK